MSPTVPPISTIVTSIPWEIRMMHCLISSVTWGTTLHRPAEVVAATLFCDDRMVDPAGRVVVFFGQG